MFRSQILVAGSVLSALACSAVDDGPQEIEVVVHPLVGDGTSIWDNVTPPAVESQGDSAVRGAMDALVLETAIEKQYPGMQAAVTKDGKLIYSGSFGFAKWDEKSPMRSYSRIPIGSTSKVMVTLGMLKLAEQRSDVSIERSVYGSGGVLVGQPYSGAYDQGVRRFHPIVDSAIGQNNQVTTWYRDGNYTVGDSSDLDSLATAQPYQVPASQTPQTVLAVAQGGDNDRVFAWYRDGSYSVGTASNLGAYEYMDGSCDGCGFRSNSREKIIGIAADTEENVFYAYYHDGKVTSGTSPDNLKNRWNGETRDFTVPTGVNRYDMVGVARSDNDVMVAWFSNGKVSKGNSNNLGSISSPYDYTRRTYQGSISQWLDAYKAIQIQHLLSHTAGFTRSGDYDQARIKYGLSSSEDSYVYSNLYMLSTRPLLFAPGTDYSYSNHGMGLVGHLIHTLTGQDWYEYLYENVLWPAGARGIKSGGLGIDPAIDAKGHSFSNDTLTTRGYSTSDSSGSAAGSLRASAGDLARVLVATDRRSNYPDVLSGPSLDTMESRSANRDNRALGWGLMCQNECSGKRLNHNGLVAGSGAYIVKYQDFESGGEMLEDITVSIVANRDTTSGLQDLATYLARLAAAADIDGGVDYFPEVVSHTMPQ